MNNALALARADMDSAIGEVGSDLFILIMNEVKIVFLNSFGSL